MPATRKRSRKHQFQSGNQKRTEWTAIPAATAAAAAAAAAAAGRGGDGDGVDSLADFPYNLCDRKPGDQSQKSGLGKMRLVHVDKNCDMWNTVNNISHGKVNRQELQRVSIHTKQTVPQRSALEKQRRSNCHLSWWPHRLHCQCPQTRNSV